MKYSKLPKVSTEDVLSCPPPLICPEHASSNKLVIWKQKSWAFILKCNLFYFFLLSLDLNLSVVLIPATNILHHRCKANPLTYGGIWPTYILS